MTRFAAFLRGINLGNRRVTNDRLREVVAELGDVSEVSAFLASGNVVFDGSDADPDTLETTLEGHLEDSLGYPVVTLVRPLDELAILAADEDLEARCGEGFRPHVIFVRSEIGEAARAKLAALEGPDDRFETRGRGVVWLRRGNLSDSTIEPRHLERALDGMPNTMRTLNTVRRIVSKFGA